MSDRIVSFTDMAFKLRGENCFQTDRCKHVQVTLDDEGGIVTCDACGKQLDAYLTLRRMCEKWEAHSRDIASARERLREEASGTVVLRAALRVQDAWRSRTMLPTCPHCHKAIAPEDGFGSSGSVNKEMELARRKRGAHQTGDNS